jgi:NADPH:quinone reductase-like Zn-dependent oxidoreductase
VKGSLKPGGKQLMVIFEKLSTFVSAKRNEQVIEVSQDDDAWSSETYAQLLDLVARGELRPVIDKVLPFEHIAEAHRRVDTGRKIGSVVLTFA